jgi:hypothetical protein
MPFDPTELDVHKYHLVRQIFVDTADDNYILSRWSYSQGLNVDFSWLAVHALEKYFKAMLLMNGRSGVSYSDATGKQRKFGHNIVALHEQVQSFAGDLLPIAMIKPNGVGGHWHAESVEAFLRRLYRDGNADNRYALFGYVHHPFELYKLDQMVFAVRRLCLPLDAHYLNEFARNMFPGEGREFTNRDLLLRQPGYWDQIGGKLPEAIGGRRGDMIRETLLHENFAFSPPNEPPKTYQWRTSSNNSVLYNEIMMPLEQGDREGKDRARALGEWLIKNVQLPQDVVDEMSEAINKPE